ncbi:hypothetical protein L7F22_001051 [Adiantum nelumboides]|nr:hypothetical protein [Adiantum nelumboides]
MGYNVKAAIAGPDSGVPSCDHFIEPSLPRPLLHSKVRNVCRALLEQWAPCTDDQFSVSEVSGGITNLLLKASNKAIKGEGDSVTVRIFGPNTEEVIDRNRELQVVRPLSDAGFGAKLLGVFQNGMVQSFIDARTLTSPEMTTPSLASLIAKEVRRLHELALPGPKDAQLWTDISRLLEKASSISFEDDLKQQRYNLISFKKLREEVQSLKIKDKDSVLLEILYLQIDLGRVVRRDGDIILLGDFNARTGNAQTVFYDTSDEILRELDVSDLGLDRCSQDREQTEYVSQNGDLAGQYSADSPQPKNVTWQIVRTARNSRRESRSCTAVLLTWH